MKEYIPDYYRDFQCIADQCKDSCCIGWEIMIDMDSYRKYQKVQGKFHDQLMNGIEYGNPPVFHLDSCERCVFLNEKNLCNIYIQLGEDALCEICTQHPRFHNEYGTICQSGLGMACEEAARLIFESKEFKLEMIQDTRDNKENCFEEKIFKIQVDLLNILKRKEKSIEERIEAVFDLVKVIQDELNHTGELPDNLQKESIKQNHILRQMREESYIKNWLSIYQQLDFMDQEIQKIFIESEQNIQKIKNRKLDDQYMESLMSYFIYRYFMKSCEDDNLIDKIKFAILNCLMIEVMNQYYQIKNVMKTPIEIARIYSKEIEYSQENIDEIFEEFLFE